MILGIDASNIRAGGGLTHLKEVLTHADPQKYGFEKVVVWGGSQLRKLPIKSWLELNKIDTLDDSSISRIYWRLFRSKKAFKLNCDILWSPGGTFYSASIPYISMSQNMLVFEEKERNRFPTSITKLRYLLLNFLQSRSFKNAKGVVFLTKYAKNHITKQVAIPESSTSIISHGVSTRFKHAPKKQHPITFYSRSKPFRILYVSIINYYKHQIELIEAIKALRQMYPIELVLIGPMFAPCEKEFHKAIQGYEKFIIYKGAVDYLTLNKEYLAADMFAFCSTCENMPNILIEAMSSGLPILSSSYGPMPEVLQDGGHYCDPLNPVDVKRKIEVLIKDPHLRMDLAEKSSQLAASFTWKRCAEETFKFITERYKANN